LTVNAQNLSNYRNKTITANLDTISLDSLSILASSFELYIEGQLIDNSVYILDDINAKLIITESLKGKELKIRYRTFPYLFSQKYFNKDFDTYKEETEKTGFLLRSANSTYNKVSASEIIDFGSLDYNGNISRGIGFGNSQSLNINSSFNIQLAGMITDDIEIKAAITDNNIPIQPEGNTAQLQEFDKVFIQLRKDKHFLTVGDFDLVSPSSYFMKFQRNLQGASYQGEHEIENLGTASGMASFAISNGNFVINDITAIEGNQGPYRLEGSNGENYIIVMAGSERVYINGVQQERGDNNDYTIDYNVGEITFTPNKMITQDMRIRVEFEYSDRYYLRTLYHVNGGLENEKFKAEIDFFSQQDSKNQTINQDLDNDDITILENAGDDIENALSSSASQIDFDASRVLYEKHDTIINGQIDSFYVYSNDEDATLYSLSFSYIGEGLGDYEPITSVANGSVYEYQGPNEGSYLPVIKLVAPEKQQMLNGRFTYKASKEIQTGVEMALSNKDINTFSNIDQDNNVGLALNLFYQQQKIFKKDSTKSIQINASYEFKQDNFNPLERYRAVEFERNWNIDSDTSVNENLANLSLTYTKANKASVAYQLNFLSQDTLYKGFENALQTNYSKNGFENNNTVSYLYAKTDQEVSQFLRPSLVISKSFKQLNNWRVGAAINNEINQIRDIETDTLSSSSFLWQEYSTFIQNADSAKNQYKLSYTLRYQHLADGKQFDKAYLKAQNIELDGRFLGKKNHTLNWNLTYRNLQQDTLYSAESDLEHFYLGRIDYSLVVFKGAIRGNSVYEIGAGREQKIQYSYIEDPNGQGSYAWEDINDNGVQELNEFYVSAFSNENTFIKTYTNSLEYQPVNSTSFNQSINLNPKAVWFQQNGFKSIIGRFSSTSAFQFSKKVYASKFVNFANVVSPVTIHLDDSLLVSNNTNIRNIVFFNRSDVKYGFEYTYQYSASKTLLTSGFDKRKYIINTIKSRWNFIKNFTLSSFYSTGYKQNDSDFYFDRIYEYIFNETGANVSWLYKNKLRIELAYQYGFKSNPLPVYGGQFAVNNEIEMNIKYSRAGNYSITSQITYTSVGYNDDSFENEQLEFDILQGLQEGNNYVWNLGLDKTFAKLLQVSLQYDGRKTGESKSVHGGRVQVRAIF